MKYTAPYLGSFFVGALCTCVWSQTSSDSSDQETYHLRYNLRAGERLAYRVEHLATVDTTIQGNRQTSKSRSISTKVWQVQQVDTDGRIHFAHSIEDVDMWSQVGGRQPVRYQSRKDKESPLEYEKVAQTLGKQLAVVTMDRSGKVEERKDQTAQNAPGVGGLVVPLPPGPVKVGATWSVPSMVPVRTMNGTPESIETSQRYELKSVEAGVATISVTTQVVTTANDPHIRAQLMQGVISGDIKFDVAAGRIVSKQLDWNESVADFNGPQSNMKSVAEFSETLVPEAVETAKKP